MSRFHQRRRICGPAMAAAASLTLGVVGGISAVSAAPPIRTSPTDPMPACATPERLMAFLKAHNNKLDPRFRDIAASYKKHGEAWRVRWDYAFFQMAIETNFLSYRRPGGRMGDVAPKQNNFAGIGTTGGGVPGDAYPDVGTGVLAQIQHLVVYSGERVADPVAPRTRLSQAGILAWTQPLSKKRPVTFQDLAGKWAADRQYGNSIDAIAARFRDNYCRGQENVAAAPGSARSALGTAAIPAPSGTELRSTGQHDAQARGTSQSSLGKPNSIANALASAPARGF